MILYCHSCVLNYFTNMLFPIAPVTDQMYIQFSSISSSITQKIICVYIYIRVLIIYMYIYIYTQLYHIDVCFTYSHIVDHFVSHTRPNVVNTLCLKPTIWGFEKSHPSTCMVRGWMVFDWELSCLSMSELVY